MIKKIVGGVITLAIGGTTYAITNADIAKNFSQETGMTQTQAQQYVDNIQKSDLESFSKIGQEFIDDGNSVMSDLATIDCDSYVYEWESPSLSCVDGKNQLRTVGTDEIALGKCYQALDSNLGSGAKSTISSCLTDIDRVNADYALPIVTSVLDSKTITEQKNINIYNKSVLKAALESN